MDAKSSIHLSINKLQDLLDHDESTSNNPRLKKQVEKVIDSLGVAKQLLKDVDALAEAPFGGSVDDRRNTVRLLRAVYAAEDAADSFIAAKEFRPIQKELNADDYSPMDMINDCRQCKVGLEMFIIKTKYFHRQFLFTHKLKRLSSPIVFTKKMKKFNDEVKRLVKMKGAGSNNSNQTRLLSLENALSQRQHWGRISDFCFEEETHVVGLQQQINKLVDLLIPRLNHNVGQSSGGTEIEALDDQTSHVDVSTAQVIAVVGEGGSGKTSLARIVYHSLHVKRHFATRAWVRISSMFNARDVLLDILTQIGQPADLVGVVTLPHDALKRRLSKLLANEERFLIVLDGVDSLQDWESLVNGTFSSSSQGAKIVITTRNPSSIAQSAVDMCRLDDEESWKLFSNKVRITEDELNKLDQLITLKEQILKVCAGLPLLIVLLGGLLSTKARNFDEWSRVVSMLADKTSKDVILALSYQDLPSEAKPCYLYMGIFPRNYEIPVRRLIHLWRCEGFVTLPPGPEEIDSEDVAEMCLEELVTRNMVEVRWRLDGVPKTCCMPSVVYDFFSPKAANVEFFHQQFRTSHTVPAQQKLAVRRLTAYTGINHLPTSVHHLRLLQSYVAFDNRVPITPDIGINLLLNKIIGDIGFVLLRVLTLEGVFKPKLHLILDKLLLLRHLGLRSSLLDDFPVSKTCLPFLDTLDVKHTNVKDIILQKTNKLQHIYLNYNYETFSERSGENVFPPVSTNLGTLWGLNMKSDDIKKGHYRILFDMRKLTKLELRVAGFGSALLTVAEWINKLTQLQSLKLNVTKSNDTIFNGLRMDGHRKLQEVHFRGSLRLSVIDGFFPPNIKKLILSLSELREDPMPVLGQLSHLNILRLLSTSYKGKRMTCLSKGFPKLYQLKLWKIMRVQEWTIEEGAMPCLRELEIRSCQQLKLVQGLQNVTALKDLVLTNMPEDLGTAIFGESLHEIDVYIRHNTWNSTLFPE